MTVVEILIERLKPVFTQKWNKFENLTKPPVQDVDPDKAFRTGLEMGYWKGVSAGIEIGIDIHQDEISRLTNDSGL